MSLVANPQAACSPPLCAPQGPDDPWGSVVLIITDSARVLLVLLALWVLITVTKCAVYSVISSRIALYLSVDAFCIIIAGTELSHIGDDPHWRFALAAFAVGTAALGMRGASSNELTGT